MRRIALIIFALALGVLGARAHAMLDHASPLVGSTAREAPRQVVLWFTQNLEPAFSRIEVRNESGARVDDGKTMFDRSNRNQMRVALRSLPPGRYKVSWYVLSVDTHRTQGDFSFRVGE